MIFHHPLPLERPGWSASAIRPSRMVRAFEEIGYRVHVVAGHSAERARAARALRRAARHGTSFDFLYAESSTMPTLLADPHHLPLRPFVDFGLFAWCRRASIPVGLFYRDIHWRFPRYDAEVPPPYRWIAKAFYRYDLRRYRSLLDVWFLPSLEMASWIPELPSERAVALPPGHDPVPSEVAGIPGALRLFYVGGLSDLYRLHRLFEAVERVPEVELTVCTRAAEWARSRHAYPSSSRIRIVHAHGAELDAYYRACDVAVLAVEPQVYWEFAAPAKLYEYIGRGRPVLASRQTLAGQVVEREGIGWTVDYDVDSLAELLRQLVRSPERVRACAARARGAAGRNAWEARASAARDALLR